MSTQGMWFGSPALWGWLHVPDAGCSHAAVLCPPMGYEAWCSYQTYRALAHDLGAAGVGALRIDYAGTGSSSGSYTEPDQVARWLASVRAAVGELRRRGIARVSLVGLRFGGMLAAIAACEPGLEIDALVLWDPVLFGKRYARELKGIALTGGSAEPEAPDDGRLGVAGTIYLKDTLAAIATLDLLTATAPIPRVARALFLERPERPLDAAMVERWTAAGIAVARAPANGLPELLETDNENAQIPRETVAAIVAALATPTGIAATSTAPAATDIARTNAAPAATDIARTSAASATDIARTIATDIARTSAAADLAGTGATDTGRGATTLELVETGEGLGLGDAGAAVAIREHAVTIAPVGLFGILGTPADDAKAHLLVMLGGGTEHQIGPGRVWVEFARALNARGIATLRADVDGVGDSGVRGPRSVVRSYDPEHVLDVGDLVAFGRARGYAKISVLGLCSGAWLAVHGALRYPIDGIFTLNAQLHWVQGMEVYSTIAEARHKELTNRAREVEGERDGRWDHLDSLGFVTPAIDWLTQLAGKGVRAHYLYAENDEGLQSLRARNARALARLCAAQPELVLVEEQMRTDHGMHRFRRRPEIFAKLLAFLRAV